MPDEVDVVIVGARCAGSAAATVFARRGRRVLVLDKSSFPSDTLSSHTLFSGTLTEFDRLGATRYFHRLNPPDLRTTKLHSRSGELTATFTESLTDDYAGTVSSARRYLLDQALNECATDAGAEIRTEARVESVVWRGGRAAGVVYRHDGEQITVRAKLVLGADGQFSTVAELVGANEPYRWSHSPRAAMLRYLIDPATEGPEATTLHHSRNGTSLAFAFPTAPRGQTVVMFIDERHAVEAARQDPEVQWQRQLALHPAFLARYAGATEMEPLRFHDELQSFFKPSSGPGWALIGDAGHFKDPILGQGIRDATWAGRTIAEQVEEILDSPALLDVALRRWERERNRECLPAYLTGVMESRTMGDSEAVVRFARALDRRQIRIIDAFGQRGPGVVGRFLRRDVVGALVEAVRHSPHPVRTATELGGQALGLIGGGVRLRGAAFRDSRPHPWEVPVRGELDPELLP